MMNQYYKNLDRKQIEESCPSCKKRDSLRYDIKEIYSPGYVKCRNNSCKAKIIFDSTTKSKVRRAVGALEDQEIEFLELMNNKFNRIKIDQ